MNRVEEGQLLDFCTEQRERFRADDWKSFGRDHELMSLVAYLLSGATWYGRRDELLSVSGALHPALVGNGAEAVERLQFDCSRFCHMLRSRLENARGA